MSQTLFVRPDKRWDLFGTVTTDGTTDPDHDLAWLVDGRPGFPLRLTDTTAVITIAKSSILAPDIVAICHHLLDEDLVVTIGGDVTGGSPGLIIPAYPPNGVPYNAWDLVVASSPVSTVTLSITGNSTPILIGETVIGEATALDPSLRISDAQFGNRRYLNSVQPDLSGIPPYSERARSRTLRGSQYYSAAMLLEILDWFDSQDGYAYPVPSLLIPDTDDPTDARLVQLMEPQYTRVGPEGSDVEFLVELEFHEHPRTRW